MDKIENEEIIKTVFDFEKVINKTDEFEMLNNENSLAMRH